MALRVTMSSMKPYSEDLRTRIVKAVGDGMSMSKVARLFGVSLSSTKRYVKIANRGEPLRPRKGGGRPPKTDELTKKLLEEDVQERPAATISERRSFLERACGRSQVPERLHRWAALEEDGLQSKNGLWGRWSKTSG